MNPTTQPSEGAVRAAEAIEAQFDMNMSAEDRAHLVRVIDRKTGVGELVEVLKDLLRLHFDPRAHDFGCARERFDVWNDEQSAAWSQARQVLSRHTSTQGKEGKL